MCVRNFGISNGAGLIKAPKVHFITLELEAQG